MSDQERKRAAGRRALIGLVVCAVLMVVLIVMLLGGEG